MSEHIDGDAGQNGRNHGVLARIRISLDHMSDAEKRVGKAFLEDSDSLIDLSVESIAGRIGVSSATIVRFAQAIGFRGLRDFKLTLASEVLGDHVRDVHEAIARDDSVLTIAQKVLQSDEDAIADSRQVLDETALEQAVEAIVSAKHIEFFGIGSSMPIAMDAYYRFARIGLPVAYATDPYMQAVSSLSLREQSVAFAISHGGSSEETLRAFEIAKRYGATCIVLTSHRGTPLGDLADIELVTASRETEFRTDAMSSRIAHLSLVDALYVAVAMRSDHARSSIHKLGEIINWHPEKNHRKTK